MFVAGSIAFVSACICLPGIGPITQRRNMKPDREQYPSTWSAQRYAVCQPMCSSFLLFPAQHWKHNAPWYSNLQALDIWHLPNPQKTQVHFLTIQQCSIPFLFLVVEPGESYQTKTYSFLRGGVIFLHLKNNSMKTKVVSGSWPPQRPVHLWHFQWHLTLDNNPLANCFHSIYLYFYHL